MPRRLHDQGAGCPIIVSCSSHLRGHPRGLTMEPLRAGAAETVITPPPGVDLTGYGNRPSTSVGKHDDLYARAVVLEAGGRQLAFVSLDLLGFEIPDADELRRRVQEE